MIIIIWTYLVPLYLDTLVHSSNARRTMGKERFLWTNNVYVTVLWQFQELLWQRRFRDSRGRAIYVPSLSRVCLPHPDTSINLQSTNQTFNQFLGFTFIQPSDKQSSYHFTHYFLGKLHLLSTCTGDLLSFSEERTSAFWTRSYRSFRGQSLWIPEACYRYSPYICGPCDASRIDILVCFVMNILDCLTLTPDLAAQGHGSWHGVHPRNALALAADRPVYLSLVLGFSSWFCLLLLLLLLSFVLFFFCCCI